MQTEMFTKENGLMTKRMEKERILMLMEPTTKDSGSMINNTVKELKAGRTVQDTKADT